MFSSVNFILLTVALMLSAVNFLSSAAGVMLLSIVIMRLSVVVILLRAGVICSSVAVRLLSAVMMLLSVHVMLLSGGITLSEAGLMLLVLRTEWTYVGLIWIVLVLGKLFFRSSNTNLGSVNFLRNIHFYVGGTSRAGDIPEKKHKQILKSFESICIKQAF